MSVCAVNPEIGVLWALETIAQEKGCDLKEGITPAVLAPLGAQLKMTMNRTLEWKDSQLKWMYKLAGAPPGQPMSRAQVQQLVAKLAGMKQSRLKVPLQDAATAVFDIAKRLGNQDLRGRAVALKAAAHSRVPPPPPPPPRGEPERKHPQTGARGRG